VNDPVIWEAARCLQRGWVPVPVELGGKAPALGPAWENVRPTMDTIGTLFNNRSIGVLLGAPSNNLVDVDIDCDEALAFTHFLPATPCRFGRGGKETHFMYHCPLEKTRKMMLKEAGTLIEARSTGGQTVIPPSWHEAGQRMWTADGPPAVVDPKVLLRAVESIAAMALLTKAFKAEGIRHDAAMALAGGSRAGWSTIRSASSSCASAKRPATKNSTTDSAASTTRSRP
jgi:hypothetical protein